MTDECVQVVDLFAGPGGLGEGFADFQCNRRRPFRIELSVEADEFAHGTLKLRAAVRAARRSDERRTVGNYWEYVRSGSPAALAAVMESPAGRLGTAEVGSRPLRLGRKEDDELVVSTLRKLRLSASQPWVLIGGPPCQAYSLVGRARMSKIPRAKFESDHRHVLYREYLRIIEHFRPALFVMENVKGLLSASLGNRSMIDQIIDDLRRAGARYGADTAYEILSLTVPTDQVSARQLVVRCEEFGVPQARHRIFILGVRADLRGGLTGGRGNRDLRTLLIPSSPLQQLQTPVEAAIGDLQPLLPYSTESGVVAIDDPAASAELDSVAKLVKSDPKLRAIVEQALATARRRTFRVPSEASENTWRDLRNFYGTELVQAKAGRIPNHEARGHMPRDLARYLFAAAWAQRHDESPKLGQASQFPTELMPAHINARSGHFADRFRVQLKGRPATTITSHISKDGHYYIHYDPAQHRSLTVREAARLQTFPDDYVFEGPRTAQYHQAGNAVPPFLARQIAGAVYAILRNCGGA